MLRCIILARRYLFPLLTNLLNMALRDHSAPQALQLLTALIRSVSTSKLLLEKFEKHISSIVTCLMHLYDRSASERLHERLLTLCIICLIMPTRKIYVRDLPLYLRPVVLSLNMPQFTKVAIRIIEWWVDLVSPDQLCVSIMIAVALFVAWFAFCAVFCFGCHSVALTAVA